MKIEYIWAYVVEDENGNESIGGYENPKTHQWIPLLAADKVRFESLKPYAHHLSAVSKSKVRAIKFSLREEIEWL